MADIINTEDMGSGMLRAAARLEKYRPQYNKVVIEAAQNGEEPPEFSKWAEEQAQKDQGAVKLGAMQKLRNFIAK